MIFPTIGRVVWYWPNGDESGNADAQPYAAIIARVRGENCVNLMVIGQSGTPIPCTSVWLHQGDGPRPEHPFCEWMPFQRGQQAKTEEAEKALALASAARAAGPSGY